MKNRAAAITGAIIVLTSLLFAIQQPHKARADNCLIKVCTPTPAPKTDTKKRATRVVPTPLPSSTATATSTSTPDPTPTTAFTLTATSTSTMVSTQTATLGIAIDQAPVPPQAQAKASSTPPWKAWGFAGIGFVTMASIVAMFFRQRPGMVRPAAFDDNIESTVDFFHALKDEMGFPELDAASKDATADDSAQGPVSSLRQRLGKLLRKGFSNKEP